MEEKFLIKSTLNKKFKIICLSCIVVFLLVSLTLLPIALIKGSNQRRERHKECFAWSCSIDGYHLHAFNVEGDDLQKNYCLRFGNYTKTTIKHHLLGSGSSSHSEEEMIFFYDNFKDYYKALKANEEDVQYRLLKIYDFDKSQKLVLPLCFYSECLALFIIHWSLSFLAGILSLTYYLKSTAQLIITDKNIERKTPFKKKILPIDEISSYSVRSFLSTIIIATSSGNIKLTLIENIKDFEKALSAFISKRQNSQSLKKLDKLEQLTKLKDLFKSGSISEDEFNAFKNDILNN